MVPVEQPCAKCWTDNHLTDLNWGPGAAGGTEGGLHSLWNNAVSSYAAGAH